MQYKKGFTIIEVMLFLAISGGLAVLLFAGTSMAIQRQQYRDAVQSYATFMGGQYAKAVSVENNREDGEDCNVPGVASAPRGQSECVVVGRYISTDYSGAGVEGRAYSVQPVYSAVVGGVRYYGLGNSDESYGVNWGAKTRFSDQADGASVMSILIYRHPDHGSMMVRTDNNRYSSADIEGLFSGSLGSAEAKEVCVYDQQWMSGERRSVFIGARSGSSDAVTVGNATGACND